MTEYVTANKAMIEICNIINDMAEHLNHHVAEALTRAKANVEELEQLHEELLQQGASFRAYRDQLETDVEATGAVRPIQSEAGAEGTSDPEATAERTPETTTT